MTTHEPDDPRAKLEKRERYSRWMNYSLWAGIAALAIATAVWIVYPEDLIVFAGTGLYWLGFLGFLGVYFGTSVSVDDERDARIASEAGGVALGLVAVITVFLTPAAVAVDVTGTYEVPSEVWGIVWAYIFLFVVFGVAHWYFERKHT